MGAREHTGLALELLLMWNGPRNRNLSTSCLEDQGQQKDPWVHLQQSGTLKPGLPAFCCCPTWALFLHEAHQVQQWSESVQAGAHCGALIALGLGWWYLHAIALSVMLLLTLAALKHFGQLQSGKGHKMSHSEQNSSHTRIIQCQGTLKCTVCLPPELLLVTVPLTPTAHSGISPSHRSRPGSPSLLPHWQSSSSSRPCRAMVLLSTFWVSDALISHTTAKCFSPLPLPLARMGGLVSL